MAGFSTHGKWRATGAAEAAPFARKTGRRNDATKLVIVNGRTDVGSDGDCDSMSS